MPLNGILDTRAGILATDPLLEPPTRLTIMVIVDQDASRQTLLTLLENDGYRVICARRPAEGLEILHRVPIDLVVLEMLPPDSDSMEFCRHLRAERRTELMPVLMLARAATVEHEIAAIGSGADGFLAWPFQTEVFSARLRSMLRHKAIVDRLEESETILQALAQAVEQRDYNAAGHCDRLAALSVAMGTAMGLPDQQLMALHRGGYLHDIGKIGIPDAVLFKAGPLTESEWRIMRTHAARGEEICRPIKSLSAVLPIIRSHHERWDGSGYPDGLSGQNIPLLARVMQFADIYDALMSTRCYKLAMSSADALVVMQEETDRGWHDPELMRLFLRLRHAEVSDAEQWQDVQVMRESLENLRSSLLRS